MDHWIRMRRSLARFSGLESSVHTRYSADFIITTFAFRFSVHTGVPTRRPIMRHLITMIALLALVDGSAAIAQPAGPRNPAAPPSVNSDQQMLPEAPVGHRQPRADQVPSEKNLMNLNDPVNQENAALDRMINGICRGC